MKNLVFLLVILVGNFSWTEVYAQNMCGTAPQTPAPVFDCGFTTDQTIEDFGNHKLKVNFHFIAYDGQNYQCSDPSAPYYAPDMVNALMASANDKWDNLSPALNGVPIAKFGLEWVNAEVLKGNPECDGIYFWNSKSAYSKQDPDVIDIIFDGSSESIDPVTGKCSSKKGYDGVWLGGTIQIFNVMCRTFTGGFYPPSISGLLNHEMGHGLGLNHVFQCGDSECEGIDIFKEQQCNSCHPNIKKCGAHGCVPQNPCQWNSTLNLMNYGACQCAITPCQAGHMISYILLNKPSFIDNIPICDTNDDEILYSGQNVIWNHKKLISGDIIVNPGAVLTINCDVQINGEIVVKRGARLNVYNSTISPLCNDTWLGMSVWGNSSVPHGSVNLSSLQTSDPGYVHLVNASLIKAQGAGIVTTRRGGYHPDHWGGIIQAEDTKFTDCKKGVAFMKYGHQNISFFKRCVFSSQDGPGGVSLWAVRGIVFDECTFNDFNRVDDYGIQSYVSSFSVINDTRFRDLDFGVDASNPLPIGNLPVTIGDQETAPNDFKNCTFGILFRNLLDATATNNYMSTGIIGVHCEGAGRYTIERNALSEFTYAGVSLYRTAGFRSKCDCNIFDQNQDGIFLDLQMDELSINNNVFSNSLNRDVFGKRNLELIVQGRRLEPRTNLFSSPQGSHREIRFTSLVQKGYWCPDKNHPLTNQALVPDCMFSLDLNPCARAPTTYFGKDAVTQPRMNVQCLNPGPGVVGDGDPNFIVGEINQNNFDSVYNLLINNQSLIDDNQTGSLLNSVQDAGLNDDLTNILSSAVPFISDTIISTILNNQAVTDSAKLSVILNLTPIGADQMTLAQSTLSAQSYQSLESAQLSNPFSAMDSLRAEIGHLQSVLSEIGYQLIEQYEEQSDLYSYMDVVNDLGLDGAYLEVSYHIGQGDHLASANSINSLPASYSSLHKSILHKVNNSLNDTAMLVLDSLFLDSLLTPMSNKDDIDHTIAVAAWTYFTGESVMPLLSQTETLTSQLGTQKYNTQSTSSDTRLQSSDQIRLVPNPTTSWFIIEGLDADCDDYSYLLVDVNGKLCQSGMINDCKVTTENLVAGMFMVSILKNGVPTYFSHILIQQ